jgi:hypothetical protein
MEGVVCAGCAATTQYLDTYLYKTDSERKLMRSPMRVILTLSALLILAACDVPFVPLI